jgi:hypothetical protein
VAVERRRVEHNVTHGGAVGVEVREPLHLGEREDPRGVAERDRQARVREGRAQRRGNAIPLE